MDMSLLFESNGLNTLSDPMATLYYTELRTLPRPMVQESDPESTPASESGNAFKPQLVILLTLLYPSIAVSTALAEARTDIFLKTKLCNNEFPESAN